MTTLTVDAIKNGKDVMLTKKGIEYYYSLIWLVRDEILIQNHNLLKKKKKPLCWQLKIK